MAINDREFSIRAKVLKFVGPAFAAFTFAATGAEASVYDVAQCAPGHRGSSATVSGSTTAYGASTGCTTGGWLKVDSIGTAPAASGRNWIYRAPPGTRFDRIRADFSLVGGPDHDGNRAILFVARTGAQGNDILSSVSAGSLSGTYDSSVQDAGSSFSGFGVGMSCSKTSLSCSRSLDHQARLGGVALRLRDLERPATPTVSGPARSGWISGDSSLSVVARDTGAGVDRLHVAVNGVAYESVDVCDADPDGGGYVTSMSPCPESIQRSIALDVSQAPFREGPSNAVEICSREYGDNPQSRCATTQVRVDNAAPQPPTSLRLDGGAGWRRDNEFDLTWSNPTQDHAPITGARVEIRGEGGTAVERSASAINGTEDLTVPGPGSHTARVRLVDAAGNISSASAGNVELKFDDVVPPGSALQIANGWLSAEDLDVGYLQTWTIPAAAERPPSGIAGYRVGVDQQPTTDPCAGGSDLRVCAKDATEIGAFSNSRVLGREDVAEGANYVHVVPISGSGIRASGIGHTRLDVDLSPPEVKASGARSAWHRAPIELVAEAADRFSGMEDRGLEPDGDAPATFLRIDDETSEVTGARASGSIGKEGMHEVEYWARDLAGNVSERHHLRVGVDGTAPVVAFASAQDPNDPDRVVATVDDGLSGVKGGTISYRAEGRPWQRLATSLRNGHLVAHAHSESMAQEVSYEFKAEVVDLAGNRAMTTERSDGSPMRTVGPFKPMSSIGELRINGRDSVRVKLGRPATVEGRLVDEAGAGIAGAPVVVFQKFAEGSSRRAEGLPVETDGDGRFAVRLPKGPSREVTARFSGSRTILPSRSSSARLKVRSRIVLKVKRKARAGGRVRFRGRVRAPGAARGARGKRVEIQVRVGRRWKAVGRSIRTGRNGAFKLNYRFVAEYRSPVRFTFRAVALRERGFPFLPSKSRKRRVLVRP